jgi:hypothetical protein
MERHALLLDPGFVHEAPCNPASSAANYEDDFMQHPMLALAVAKRCM